MHKQRLTFATILVLGRQATPDPWVYAKRFSSHDMEEQKPSPFALNKGRIVILALGVLAILIAISTSLGGINAYQALRQANTEATTAAPAPTP
jgi:hypothetical protein